MTLSNKLFFSILTIFLSMNFSFSQDCQPGDPGYISIDFETDGEGNELAPGAVIDASTYSALGIYFQSNVTSDVNPNGNYPLVIFDSSNPTGGDCDLGTPSFNCLENTTDDNNNCVGDYPGKSDDLEGGEFNCEALGNLLIISENYPYTEIGQPDPNPDDLRAGGKIQLEFVEPLTVIDIGFVDDAVGSFVFNKADGTQKVVDYAVGKDNDVFTYDIDEENVLSMDIVFVGSGALSFLSFCNTITQQAALPVELKHFDGVTKGAVVELEWTTASELNADYFNVERSSNGVDFQTIAKVYAAGNSVTDIDYNHTDSDLIEGKIYYRLEQVDLDGMSEYSEIIVLERKSEVIIQVFPNPTVEELNITVSSIEHIESVNIIDGITGNRIEHMLLSKGNNNITTFDYQDGIYIVQLVSKNGEIVTMKRIVKLSK